MTEKKRLLAIIMAVIITALVLGSAVFIIDRSHHECAGESCPVCADIALCEGLLSGLSHETGGAAAHIVFAAVLFSALFSACAFTARKTTPVSLMVKLSN
ncbi:MAG: hypothetical protein IIZ19_03970 [Clostridia bacterium]|nr:hypothetical protein [Clostridia bacterium]